MYSFKYNQQDATIYNNLFIIVYAPRVSGGFSAQHRELKNYTQSIWYVPGLLAATASCVYSSWAPDVGRRNRPKHVEHRQ